MERDASQGGSDVGNDAWREIGDEPASSIRDTAPDVLAPIDADAPVSGHVPLAASQVSATEAPEHDWPTARALIRPAFRPVGTQGLAMESIDRDNLSAHAMQSHARATYACTPKRASTRRLPLHNQATIAGVSRAF